MPAFSPPCGLPAECHAVRNAARQAILWALCLLPPALAWLADRPGLGWELVTLLGTTLPLAAAAAAAARAHPRPRNAITTAALAIGCALLLATGHGILPSWLATALPFAALLLAGALLDGRALLLAATLLAAAGLLRLPLAPALAMAAALAALAGLIHLAHRMARRRLCIRAQVLTPARPGTAPIWTRPREPFALPALLVQAERAPDGTVRLAVAASAAGRLRVSVR